MVNYKDEALLRKLNQSYRNLQTSAQDNRARALLDAAALTKHQREEFAREVWEAVNVKHARISHIMDATGAARTTIYKVLKDYEAGNKNLTSKTAGSRYTIRAGAGSSHLITHNDHRAEDATWIQPISIRDGKWQWGIGQGKGDFDAEYRDEATGLKALIEQYIADNIGTVSTPASPAATTEREDLDD